MRIPRHYYLSLLERFSDRARAAVRLVVINQILVWSDLTRRISDARLWAYDTLRASEPGLYPATTEVIEF